MHKSIIRATHQRRANFGARHFHEGLSLEFWMPARVEKRPKRLFMTLLLHGSKVSPPPVHWACRGRDLWYIMAGDDIFKHLQLHVCEKTDWTRFMDEPFCNLASASLHSHDSDTRTLRKSTVKVIALCACTLDLLKCEIVTAQNVFGAINWIALSH